MSATTAAATDGHLRRSLTLWNLVVYGLIVVQPTAPMPSFGVVSQTARGHVVTAILFAMVAMFFTALSYGRMARAYPSAGSAYTYVGRELSPFLGYVTGWSMAMDYMINPLICTIWCSKAAANILPGVPYYVWAVCFAVLFTSLNLVGVKTNARFNATLAAGMGVVIVLVLAAAVRYVLGMPEHPPGFFTRPFYDPETFQAGAVFGTIESVKAASDLYAPVSGEVVEINEALVSAPEAVNTSPYEAGWMVVLRPSDPSELERLLDAAAYAATLEAA